MSELIWHNGEPPSDKKAIYIVQSNNVNWIGNIPAIHLSGVGFVHFAESAIRKGGEKPKNIPAIVRWRKVRNDEKITLQEYFDIIFSE